MVTPFERFSRILQNDSHTGGLKPTQWEALRFLGRANRFSRNPGSVTSYLGLTKGTVSQTLNSLTAKGLITKTINKVDKRAVVLSLTKKGQKLLADDPIRLIEKSIQKLPPEDRDAVSTGVEKLIGLMLKERMSKPFGLCNSCQHFARNHESGKPHFCQLLKQPLCDEDRTKICVEQS